LEAAKERSLPSCLAFDGQRERLIDPRIEPYDIADGQGLQHAQFDRRPS
jgi:hypothetical protein